MLVEVGPPALQAILGQMEAQTFTPSTRLSGKPEQIREKVFAACILIAHYWTRCALKTPYMRARLVQRQSARRTKSWKSCRWVPQCRRQTAAAVRVRNGLASNAAKTPNSPKPRNSKVPFRARRTLRAGTGTQRCDRSERSWQCTGPRPPACPPWGRCPRRSPSGRQRWVPAKGRPGLPMKTSWWSPVGLINSVSQNIGDPIRGSYVSFLSHAGDDSWDLITCYCGKPFAGRPMIECNQCGIWVHLSCAKIKKSNVPDVFYCHKCRDLRRSGNKKDT